jgi:hypothetical protein
MPRRPRYPDPVRRTPKPAPPWAAWVVEAPDGRYWAGDGAWSPDLAGARLYQGANAVGRAEAQAAQLRRSGVPCSVGFLMGRPSTRLVGGTS